MRANVLLSREYGSHRQCYGCCFFFLPGNNFSRSILASASGGAGTEMKWKHTAHAIELRGWQDDSTLASRTELSQHLGERIVCSLTDIHFKPDLCRLLENACYRVVLFTFVWYPPLSPVFCFDSPQCSFPRSSFNVFNGLTRYMKKAMLILIRNSWSFATHQTWPCVLNLELNACI